MPLKDQAKNFARKLIEKRPSAGSIQSQLRKKRPITQLFKDDGIIPNNPRLPVVVYRSVVGSGKFDRAVLLDDLFEENGWGRSWRDTDSRACWLNREKRDACYLVAAGARNRRRSRRRGQRFCRRWRSRSDDSDL